MSVSQPDEIAKADPLDADASLAGAPVAVRKASAWLASRAKSGAALRDRLLGLVPVSTLFAGLFGAAIAGDVFHSPAGAGAMFIAGAVGATITGVYAARALRPTLYAQGLVSRYRQVQELGLPADGVDTPGPTAIERIVARIEALAGDDEVVTAARRAREHARRLQAEQTHLAEIATGQPEADAALDAARDTIEAELSRTQARVAELYASLVDLRSGGPQEELRNATHKISAELEVDAKRAAGRRVRQSA